jgi:FMN phosphatase YigB (HAD superfamily)
MDHKPLLYAEHNIIRTALNNTTTIDSDLRWNVVQRFLCAISRTNPDEAFAISQNMFDYVTNPKKHTISEYDKMLNLFYELIDAYPKTKCNEFIDALEFFKNKQKKLLDDMYDTLHKEENRIIKQSIVSYYEMLIPDCIRNRGNKPYENLICFEEISAWLLDIKMILYILENPKEHILIICGNAHLWNIFYIIICSGNYYKRYDLKNKGDIPLFIPNQKKDYSRYVKQRI